jgi:hypothetical protein
LTDAGAVSSIQLNPHQCICANQVIDAFDQLVKIFLLNGYAWDGMAKIVSSGPKGTEFCLTLISPATIWGGQSLQIGKNKLQNNFL